MVKIKLNKHTIGHGCKPFIIAEAGINHNGEIKTAFEMICAAKNAGVDAIKFQTFKANEFVGDPNQKYTYRSQGKDVTESMLEMFKRYEFSRDDWFKIKKRCDDEKILFFSTPQNPSDLELLLELNVPAIKVGSDDFTNLPLLKAYSKTGLPMMISCGMSNLTEVHQSLDTIGSLDGYPTILLVTTSQYPTPPKDVNLLRLDTLSKMFSTIPLGFSDHTQGPLASSLAVALGACLFEKHFTLSHDLPGPDHWFSEDIVGLKKWTYAIKKSFTMMGSPLIQPTQKEDKMKILSRRSIMTIKEIKKGEILSAKNIGFRRPGNGLSPNFMDKILGLKATRNIKRGTLIAFGDFK